MALANGSIDAQTGEKPGAPTFVINISFDGDSSYPTGGTAAFQTFLRNTLTNKPAVEIMSVIGNDCGGYVVAYDKANDKLKVYYADYTAVASGALIEVPNTTNLAAVTFNVTCICL